MKRIHIVSPEGESLEGIQTVSDDQVTLEKIAGFQVNHPEAIIRIEDEPFVERPQYTVVDGQVTVSETPEAPSVYIHHTITGAFEGSPEGTPSVAAGETIQISLSLHESPDPASPVVRSFNNWLRVPYRINHNEKHFRRVQFVNGLANISFTPNANHFGNMSVNDGDFAEVDGFQLKLAEPISIDIDEL